MCSSNFQVRRSNVQYKPFCFLFQHEFDKIVYKTKQYKFDLKLRDKNNNKDIKLFHRDNLKLLPIPLLSTGGKNLFYKLLKIPGNFNNLNNK